MFVSSTVIDMSHPQMPAPPFGRTRARTRASRKRPLTLERILDAAFAVMAREGYSAVTMRRLAGELGTGPASLYAHIEGKSELDALVVDRVSAEVDVPAPDPERWQEQVKQLMRDTFSAMRRHPGVASASVAYIPTGPEAMRVTEGLLAILRAGGLSDQVAAYAVDLLPLYVSAHAVEEDARRRLAPGEPTPEADEAFLSRLREYFASLPAEAFPHISGLAVALTSGSGEDRFEFGLDVLLSGIAAVSSRPPTP